jgi:hypothetical protein
MQADSTSANQRLCIQSLEQGSNNLQAVMNRLQDLAALFHEGGGLKSMPFDIIAVITGVGESRQESKGTDGTGTQETLELDPRLPLSVEGDLTKVCMKLG